jgi:hypothetical protein
MTTEPQKIRPELVVHQFTAENAAENARKSHAAQKKKKTLEKHARLGVTDEIKASIDRLRAFGLERLAQDVDREDLPKMSIAVMIDLGLRVLGNEWEIKDAEQATKIAKTWHDILRLESNQATSITGQADTQEGRQSRLEELRIEAKRRVEGGLRAVAGE